MVHVLAEKYYPYTSDDITWIKMQGNMPEERVQITYDLATNESRLRINDLEYADEGTYYCTASINGVSKSVSMTLRVVGTLYCAVFLFFLNLFYLFFRRKRIDLYHNINLFI